MVNSSILVTADEVVNQQRFEQIKARLEHMGVNLVYEGQSAIEMHVSDDQINLFSPILNDRAAVGICFHQGASNHRRLYGGGKSQHLAKAIGVSLKKDLRVVDATAGLAGDSFVLATLGAEVLMLERSPVLVLMIEDALRAAKNFEGSDSALIDAVDRLSIIQTNSVEWFARQKAGNCDVIYLDPMFPERKKKAAVKKEMQVLQYLLMESEKSDSARAKEELELLEAALASAVYRVVVKRPKYAPALAGKKPGYTLEGKTTRYDIYPLKKIG